MVTAARTLDATAVVAPMGHAWCRRSVRPEADLGLVARRCCRRLSLCLQEIERRALRSMQTLRHRKDLEKRIGFLVESAAREALCKDLHGANVIQSAHLSGRWALRFCSVVGVGSRHRRPERERVSLSG